VVRRTLYVCRPLLNGAELRAWANAQGFKTVSDDLHVTIAYSRKATTWEVGKAPARLRVTGGKRSIEKLGDAIVLRFVSGQLSDRWKHICDAGASWDYPGYKPHVTITYEGGIKGEAYRGPLIFGPEQFEEIEDDKDMAETAVSPNNRTVAFQGKPTRERAMPWTGKTFAKHNHALKGKAADKAAKQASAIVAKGGDEGMAIAVASKRAKVDKLKKRGLISDRAAGKHIEGKYGGRDEQGIDAASR
jgi:hypothetical protein